MTNSPSSLLADESSLLTGENAAYLAHLYDIFCETPAAVSEEWRTYFQTLERNAHNSSPSKTAISSKNTSMSDSFSGHRENLVQAYRAWGHLYADLDPLGLSKPSLPAELDPKTYGIEEVSKEADSFDQTIDRFQRLYCGPIGFQYLHVPVLKEREWLQNLIEGGDGSSPLSDLSLSSEDQKQILQKLMEASQFESFLNKKFPGVMRFSLEGGESVLPALEAVLEQSASLGAKTVVIGMTHRGRLNILAHLLEKPLEEIFSEFNGHTKGEWSVSGDVKYHRGSSMDRVIKGCKMRLSLMPNPSHLEFIDPVVLGKVRALQDDHKDTDRSHIMGILLHGDAAFVGQGIVAESLMLSQLKGYTIGGTLHIVLNNQIGFTTSPRDGRSSLYCSDFALAIGAPVFHVNGDDPEAVLKVFKFANLYRHTFKKDVVVDVVCYRRQGHNEGDEASFTHPLMHQAIKSLPSLFEAYKEKIIKNGLLSDEDIRALQTSLQSTYQKAFEKSMALASSLKETAKKEPCNPEEKPAFTGIDKKTLYAVGTAANQVPSTFHLHPKLKKLFLSREQMAEGSIPVDWAMAEILAFGTLLWEGYPVRLTGQDTERGTFSQRHAVLRDHETGDPYIPLQHLSSKQASYDIWNSPLAESSVLGFELGYSLGAPQTLVIWEAQYGDFANGAQVIIDGFLVSGEAKWLEKSGLVLLLPHGFEGRGPDHSSARMERFLQLCGDDNMKVINPTTPANHFHALRGQIVKDPQKPLVIFTPKSLLRHKMAVSSLKDFEAKTVFEPVIPDALTSASRVVVCSGKVYYDLWMERDRQTISDIALIRLEQFYPFPHAELVKALKPYKGAEIVWCQEEPSNMGAWTFVEPYLEAVLSEVDMKTRRPLYVGRPSAASPATGSFARHEEEQALLVNKALNVSVRK